MNILVLSCGTRNKIVQYIKKELGNSGLVIATDCSNLAPALYDADKYFIVPRIDEEGYLDEILSICEENDIAAVLTLIDPEISLLAENKQKFIDIGTMPLVSDYDIVEMCFDKNLFLEFLSKNRFKKIKSYVNIASFYQAVDTGAINYPVFVKPIKGSASININVVMNKEELELLFDRYDSLIIQEYMNGIEYGADVYIDMISNEVVAIFLKEKIKMRAGETDKSVSRKNEKLFGLIERFVKCTGLKGVIDIDIFEVNGEYFISEVNPRFGGGYPHAYACGVNVPEMIMKNINNKINTEVIGEYEADIYMMKYSEIKIMKI